MISAALAQTVAQMQRRYTIDRPTRELRWRVRNEITLWAKSERIPTTDISLGMALAATTIAASAMDTERITRLRFNAAKITQEVLTRAQTRDRQWGLEPHYAVAERCVEVTYQVLANQLKSDPATLLPVIAALRQDLAQEAACGEGRESRTLETLETLAAALVAAGSFAELRTYLQVRIADWAAPEWFSSSHDSSTMEQRLLLRETGDHHTVGARDLSAAEALEGQRLLVVLGAPGTGKTWLALHYARESAKLALSELDAGVPLEEVELPLLTRWNLWEKTTDARAGLIEASFAAELGLSDLGAGDAVDRLFRTFRKHRQVLLIVDALDEAADLVDQTARLRALTSLMEWRLVVTSRPAAWKATHGRIRIAPHSPPRIVELRRLAYPAQVEDFIRAWFSTDSARGTRLNKQVQARPELRRSATIPLILTFYCILAEESTGEDDQLPLQRRQLYQHLVLKLLRGAWRTDGPGTDMASDIHQCQEMLKTWAWDAVCDHVTSAGLGNWGDALIKHTISPRTQTRALDHVVPKQFEKDFQVTRQFVHRTILEHFVAEYIADQDTQRAFELLLPHLWFDSDWHITAPAAIVAHNHRHPGELLQLILDAACLADGDLPRLMAKNEVDRLLLFIAAESNPSDWRPGHVSVIDACRLSGAVNLPQQVAASNHWTGSQQAVINVVLEALRDAFYAEIPALLATLQSLNPTEGQRCQARTTALKSLSKTDDFLEARASATVLISLAVTENDRAQAGSAILNVLPGATPEMVASVVATLTDFEISESERVEARVAVFKALIEGDPQDVLRLVETLSFLGVTDDERAQARSTVLKALLEADDPWTARNLMEVLSKLAITDDERSHTRAVALVALPKAYPAAARDVVKLLVSLSITDDERAEARTAALRCLTETNDSWQVRAGVAVLISLAVTHTHRAQARTAALNALPGAEPVMVFDLLRFLPVQGSTKDERFQARTALSEALIITDDHWTVRLLSEALPALAVTLDEQAQARAVILKAIPDANPKAIPWLLKALPFLEATADERAQARAIALQFLPEADSEAVLSIVEVLIVEELEEDERAHARTALMEVLPELTSSSVHDLMRILSALTTTDHERLQVRTKLLEALPQVEPLSVLILVELLFAGRSTDEERAQARFAILRALPYVESWAVRNLVELLRLNSSSQWWNDWLAGSFTE